MSSSAPPPAAESTEEEKPKCKICCACPETKTRRDECLGPVDKRLRRVRSARAAAKSETEQFGRALEKFRKERLPGARSRAAGSDGAASSSRSRSAPGFGRRAALMSQTPRGEWCWRSGGARMADAPDYVL